MKACRAIKTGATEAFRSNRHRHAFQRKTLRIGQLQQLVRAVGQIPAGAQQSLLRGACHVGRDAQARHAAQGGIGGDQGRLAQIQHAGAQPVGAQGIGQRGQIEQRGRADAAPELASATLRQATRLRYTPNKPQSIA